LRLFFQGKIMEAINTALGYASSIGSEIFHVVSTEPITEIGLRIIRSPLAKTLIAVPLLITLSVTILPLAGTLGALALLVVYVYFSRDQLYREISLGLVCHRARLDPEHFPYRSQITDQIILSALPLESDLDALRALNIRRVISVTEECEVREPNLFGQPITPEKWREIGADHHFFETPDCRENTVEQINSAVDLMFETTSRGGRVLVHCMAGRGRSPTLVAAYLMKYRNLPVNTAFYDVAERRPQCAPNDAQRESLQAFSAFYRSARV
jgi:atypical dual specificity phosphatase